MKQFFLMAVISLAVAASGKKDDHSQRPVDDARTVLLKEVISQTLPNPYFHFAYDSLHYVKQINFAAGFSVYNVEYENRRVKKMINTTTGNFLLYSYRNKQVAEINEFSALTGDKIFSYRFAYNNSNQLTQVLWFDFSNGSAGNLFKKSELTYLPDGNLSIIDHFSISAGQVTWVKTIQFSQYDDKTNVDDFYLLGDFFDSFLFLPQVKLQKNNPGKQLITAPEGDCEIVYTYCYENNLPVEKTSVLLEREEDGNGVPVKTASLFSYY
jgi:hypothetical protein